MRPVRLELLYQLSIGSYVERYLMLQISGKFLNHWIVTVTNTLHNASYTILRAGEDNAPS